MASGLLVIVAAIMGRRSKSAARCGRCRLHERACVCESLPALTLETRLVLVMHHREVRKTTATGPLALACLSNSERHLHGVPDRPLDLGHLDEPGRRTLVLFPYETALPLDAPAIQADPRPVTLVVPDGNWRQARRVPQRVPGLENAVRVKLPVGAPSRWGVRREPHATGLSTFEAIARALGILESSAVQRELEGVFGRLVGATLAARGRDGAGVLSAARGLGAPASGGQQPGPAEPLPIVYSDEHLVAISKPSGIPPHRGWADDGVPALQRLRDQLGRHVYPVHRLDRATSGVMLFALTSEVARDTQAIFARGGMFKRYLAICRGHSASLRQVDHPLARDRGGDRRPAVTDFRLLGAFERYGLYEAVPRDGRTHQIRRHLKHASHPIVGDVRYGKGEHNRIFRQRFGFRRLALHCHQMAFDHPRRAARVHVQAPLCDDFARLLSQLGFLDAI